MTGAWHVEVVPVSGLLSATCVMPPRGSLIARPTGRECRTPSSYWKIFIVWKNILESLRSE